MSRMTKFLRQRCWVEPYVANEHGQPLLNQFGEYQYEVVYLAKCRRESATKDVQTANGSIVQASTVYYFDSSREIKVGYRVDRHPVLSVRDYVNSQGQNEGYEVYV